jgi:hypothetical protein
MKQSYSDMNDFLEDVHAEKSIKQLVLDLGIYTKDDFRGALVPCCFHQDDTPSLQIADSFFRCYAGSCGVKGDIISFVQTFYNTGFMEAVNKIADLYGINIKGLRMHLDGKVSQLKREWDSYTYAMQNAPVEAQQLKRMFFPHEIGYDADIRYVVLPLTSKTGTILGFTKRRVDELHEKNPSTGKWNDIRPGVPASKWKHSSIKDSLISQCHNLFNLHGAANQIRMHKRVVVCEGPKDSIAYQRAGIMFSVGVCGTSNSNNIWDILLPVDSIYLSHDGDLVGIGTVIKNVIFLTARHDVNNIFALIFPEGQDPYDVVTGENGVERLLDIYNHPVSALDFSVTHGTLNDVVELYEATPEYNKVSVMRSICKCKCFSLAEAESWLASAKIANDRSKAEESMDEKSTLMAIVNGEYVDSSIKVDKAKKILRMKYGINM